MAEPAFKEKAEILRQRELISQSSGLSVQVLPPISAKKLAIYRSHEEDIIDPLIVEAQFSRILPPDTVISGTYSFNDPGEEDLYKRSKLIKNVGSMNAQPEIINGRPTGKTIYVEEIEPIIFNGGFLNVNIETQYPLYVFMELCPLNRSSKFRGVNTAFFRFDLNLRGRALQHLEEDLGLDAELKVRDMGEKDVLSYASSVPGGQIIIEKRNWHDIQRDLRHFARNNPRPFFNLLRNSDAVIRFIRAESQDKGFIVYDKDLKAWFHYGEPAPVLELPKTENNPVDALNKFLASKDGEPHLAKLEEKINYWSM